MFYIGVDLGQKQDYTVIAIVEKENAGLVNQPRLYAALRPVPARLVVRRIERVPLGTSYPRIVERIRAITHEPQLAGRCALVVDATGLGGPVVDMLREPGTFPYAGATSPSAWGLGCDLTDVGVPRRLVVRALRAWG